MALSPLDHSALRQIVDAGPWGVSDCRTIALSSLVHLEDLELITVEWGVRHTTAKATDAGRAFRLRVAA